MERQGHSPQEGAEKKSAQDAITPLVAQVKRDLVAKLGEIVNEATVRELVCRALNQESYEKTPEVLRALVDAVVSIILDDTVRQVQNLAAKPSATTSDAAPAETNEEGEHAELMQFAEDLCRSELQVYGSNRAQVLVVEPYASSDGQYARKLQEAAGAGAPYESGAFLIGSSMGNPIVTVVVDPEQGSLVRIVEVRFKGKKIPVGKLFKEAKYEKEEVFAIDGKVPPREKGKRGNFNERFSAPEEGVQVVPVPFTKYPGTGTLPTGSLGRFQRVED